MSKYYPGTIDEDDCIRRSVDRRKRISNSAITPTDTQIFGSDDYTFIDITDREIEEMFKEDR